LRGEIGDRSVVFRHPHPKIYKKIEKTSNLIKNGIKPSEFEDKGGLSREKYQTFFNIIYQRHQTLNKFLRVNKSAQLRSQPFTSPIKDKKDLQGNWNMLVLLVDFDEKTNITPEEHFKDLLFSEGKVETGSMREYYREVSWNKLNISGDIGGWYRARKKYSDYVDLGKINDETLKWTMPKAKELVKETIRQAEKSNSFQFSKYDNKDNGKIDTLIVIYSGEGAERTSNFSFIYPHRGKFSEPVELDDGLLVDNYVLMHELPSYDIGGFCHEVAHSLGVPDLYLPDFSSTIVGRWCLMGVGCYNEDGRIPAHLSAWCKIHLGWAQPQIITGDPQTYKIQAVTESDKNIYKIKFKGLEEKEYFLVENRQQEGFDKFLPSNGLLIWHVDESKALDHSPNNDLKNLFIALEQADGKNELTQRVFDFDSLGPNLTKKDLSGDEGDVYPGDTNNRTFDYKSSPNSNSSRGYKSSIIITDISDSGEEITAKIGFTNKSPNSSTIYSNLFPTSLLEVLNVNKGKSHDEIIVEENNEITLYKKGYSDGYNKAIKKASKKF
jgi:immune inhibitor A